jgi:hypothetical protein
MISLSVKTNNYMISLTVKSFANMSNPATREREIRAIQDAIQTVDTQHILILAEDTEDLIRIGDKEIQIQSIPEWLLQQPG